jgi:Ca-activated chloride channel family protein
MEWQRPSWLYLILPLAAGWLLLSLYSRRRRHRAAGAFVGQAMQPHILPADSRARFWVKLLLREAAIVAGLVALAGPRFGTQYEQVVPRGSDLYVLIDVSRSMLAQDVPPSRLGRAKADVAALINRLEGERVGLIAFAGQAVVKCPLTVDYDAFRRSLDELDPNSAPRGGTAIGDAIRKALEVFDPRAERDQAILLITDGDDQQSYPLEAAAVAAERHVTIFTVGLGDADQGARIPQGAESKSYVEYQGQQVWSKLDGKLLEEIALKTSGVYVPVGTRAYDLGELYADYLQGRRGSAAESQKRIRRADRFQIFLALALAALLADLFTRPYAAAVRSAQHGIRRAAPAPKRAAAGNPTLPVAMALVVSTPFAGVARADNPEAAVREGLRLYRADEFDKAREKFAAAREQFDRTDSGKSAVAAFDEACAFHRKGDVAHARESYLKAGLAHDKTLAAAAHFNLGTLASESARGLAGEHPENVAPEKRAEILDQLKGAVASFRHSLELQPDNARARRDIELVRLWIKYYTDRWRTHDREKRRQEMNLLAFLEFLIETQRALRESVKALPARTPADAFAELKRLQDELREEIPPLKEKIRADLQPAQASPGTASPANSQELEQGITLLQGWADAAGEKMSSAARQLNDRQAGPAAGDQQAAVAELEKIWEAVIPFGPLLARDLADQTATAGALKPASPPESKTTADESSEKTARDRDKTVSTAQAPSAGAPEASLGSADEHLGQLAEIQERTLRRTRLLKPKAEAELARLKQAPADGDAAKGKGAKSGKDDAQNPPAGESKPIDPKESRAGYEKAIELAPRAIAHMEQAEMALEKKDRAAAYPPAEAARKVLEEIQKAQPKNNDSSQKDKEKDKKKDDQQKQDQKQQQQKDEKKSEEQKDERGKTEQQKKDQEQNKQEDPNKAAEKKEEQKQPQISRDQLEEALRRVRERQQEKRERDRRMRARVSGSVPVEKDW